MSDERGKLVRELQHMLVSGTDGSAREMSEAVAGRILALADRAERAEALIREQVDWFDNYATDRPYRLGEEIERDMRAILAELDAKGKP